MSIWNSDLSALLASWLRGFWWWWKIEDSWNRRKEDVAACLGCLTILMVLAGVLWLFYPKIEGFYSETYVPWYEDWRTEAPRYRIFQDTQYGAHAWQARTYKLSGSCVHFQPYGGSKSAEGVHLYDEEMIVCGSIQITEIHDEVQQ